MRARCAAAGGCRAEQRATAQSFMSGGGAGGWVVGYFVAIFCFEGGGGVTWVADAQAAAAQAQHGVGLLQAVNLAFQDAHRVHVCRAEGGAGGR